MSKQIGSYEVVAELGRGGMGVVYKAREESLQRFVAIKMLGNQLVDNESVALRFMREARAVADLNHPNLVQVFRVDRHEDQPYFVMEYVEGESLKHLIRRERKMQPLRALQILKEVATGLAAAHAKGVIHRDIKPENIMLTKYGGVKVVDFGIARVDEPGTRLTTTGMGLGTPSYLSPEVCLSQDVDQRSDIFSLGVVLFEMLTGDTPFKSDSPFELMTKVVEARIPEIKELNPNVDDGVRQILARMIAKRPKLRYQSCNELIGDIEDYQAGRVPRLAGSMPSETWLSETGHEDEAVRPEEAGIPEKVDDSTGRATVPVPSRADGHGAPGESAVDATVALEPETGRARGARLALAAVILLLLGGAAIAGSWYMVSDPNGQLRAMFDSAPIETDDMPPTGPAAEEPVGNGDSAFARQEEPMAADPAAEHRAPGGGAEQLAGTIEPAESSNGQSNANPGPDADAGGPSIPEAGFRFAVTEPEREPEPQPEPEGGARVVSGDSIEAAQGPNISTGAELEVAQAETGAEYGTSGGSGNVAAGMVEGRVRKSAEDESLEDAMARAGESSGESMASVAAAGSQIDAAEREGAMPANPRVAVVAVGDAAVAGAVARKIKSALGKASFEVMDEQLIDGLVYAESMAGVVRTARDAGASVLVYVDVVPTGERELQFYGRRELQFLASLEVRVLDLHTQRNLGPPATEQLEYVALTADRKAREVAAPIARNVVNRLRALRAMRNGPGSG